MLNTRSGIALLGPCVLQLYSQGNAQLQFYRNVDHNLPTLVSSGALCQPQLLEL